MRTSLAFLALATLLTAGGSAAVALAADDGAGRVPAVVREDERPGTGSASASTAQVREDEGPGTGSVPVRKDDEPGTQGEPRYSCEDGICDTRGESTEGPGTDG